MSKITKEMLMANGICYYIHKNKIKKIVDKKGEIREARGIKDPYYTEWFCGRQRIFTIPTGKDLSYDVFIDEIDYDKTLKINNSNPIKEKIDELKNKIKELEKLL